jgi:hypothetical protein
MQRRAQFKEVLASSQSGLNTSRYLRLMGMAVSTLSCCIAFSIYVIVTEFSFSPLRIYDSWADVHFNFSRVGQFPRELMPDWYWQKFENAWMIVPVAGFIFFFFFGFGEEATREYKRYIRALRRHVLRQDVGDGTFLGESTFAYVFSPSYSLFSTLSDRLTVQCKHINAPLNPTSQRHIPKLIHLAHFIQERQMGRRNRFTRDQHIS